MVSLSTIKNARLEEGEGPEPITYRAIRTGKWLFNQEMYDFVDIYEMQCSRYPLIQTNYDWQKMHPGEKPLAIMRPPDHSWNRVTLLQAPEYWSETGFSYTLIVKRLKARRFYNVSEDDIKEFQQETEESEDIVFAGNIKGVSVCREILENTMEDVICHPVIEIPEPFSSGKSEHEKYTEGEGVRFEPVPCDHPDCSNCFSHPLPKKEWYAIGSPADDPKVLEFRRKKIRQAKLKRMKKFMQALQVMDSTWAVLDSLDAMDDDSEIIRTKARAEVLGKEED